VVKRILLLLFVCTIVRASDNVIISQSADTTVIISDLVGVTVSRLADSLALKVYIADSTGRGAGHYTSRSALVDTATAIRDDMTTVSVVNDSATAVRASIHTQEEIEDYAGAMTTGNTETRITVTYQDGDGTLDFVVDDMNDDVPDSGDLGIIDTEAEFESELFAVYTPSDFTNTDYLLIADSTGTGYATQYDLTQITTDSTWEIITVNEAIDIINNAVTSTADTSLGLKLINHTLATAGAQKSSPVFWLGGEGWKTNATAASMDCKFGMQLVPVQGAAAPSWTLNFLSSINKGATTTPMTLTSSGVLNPGTFVIDGLNAVISKGGGSTVPYIKFTTNSITIYADPYNDGADQYNGLDIPEVLNGADAEWRIGDTGTVMEYNVTDSLGIFYETLEAGITAVNPGGQGDGVLTAQVNVVATVGTTDDAVTLPPCTAVTTLSRAIYIVNNGANQLEIWPSSGDNAGGGVNTAITLAAGSNLILKSIDATNWESF